LRTSVVINNDADTRPFGTGAELDFGALGQSCLGELEGAVEAGQVTLLLCLCRGFIGGGG